jgi:hypothetical protein
VVRHISAARKVFRIRDSHYLGHVDHFPALLINLRTTCNLVRDQYIAATRKPGKQVRLKGAKESMVEPVHQVHSSDGLDESR